MNLKTLSILVFLLTSQSTFSSSGGASMSEEDINKVSKTDIINKADKDRLSKAASLLTNYEIESKKLLTMLEEKNILYFFLLTL
tara:strand:+ start:609 stop:860 length:252 start_codon:yes stop_codon:yes gene_type:complete